MVQFHLMRIRERLEARRRRKRDEQIDQLAEHIHTLDEAIQGTDPDVWPDVVQEHYAARQRAAIKHVRLLNERAKEQ